MPHRWVPVKVWPCLVLSLPAEATENFVDFWSGSLFWMRLILQGLTFPSQQIAILTLNFQTKTFLTCNLETKLARGKRGIICDPSWPVAAFDCILCCLVPQNVTKLFLGFVWQTNVECKTRQLIKTAQIVNKNKQIRIENRQSSGGPRPAGTAPVITKPAPACSLAAILFTRYGFRTVTGQWGTELTQTDSLKKS